MKYSPISQFCIQVFVTQWNSLNNVRYKRKVAERLASDMAEDVKNGLIALQLIAHEELFRNIPGLSTNMISFLVTMSLQQPRNRHSYKIWRKSFMSDRDQTESEIVRYFKSAFEKGYLKKIPAPRF